MVGESPRQLSRRRPRALELGSCSNPSSPDDTPWGSRLDALRLRAWSRMLKARSTPRRSTLGDGSSSCLRGR